MDISNMIEITGCDLRQVVQEVYLLSKPQGLGHLHYENGPLDQETIDLILEGDDVRCVFSMDYVQGRYCKFAVFRHDDKLYMHNSWYDHSEEQLAELCERIGVKFER